MKCFQIAVLKPLFVKFGNHAYQQLCGLPMGAACSPDIAQLYAAIKEKIWFPPNTVHPHIPFYGRYLDDVFALVYADTKEQALDRLSFIKFHDDLEMEWSVSEWNAPFLDMWVYIAGKGSQDPSIQWHPYRKALNHHERIPFVTNHPKDIKKGAFISEMSRLATLSSTYVHYQEALRELRLMYEARGYPTVLINRWLDDHASRRWAERLAPSRKELQRDTPVKLLVIKTEFNPVWDKFNVHDMLTSIQESWSKYDTTVVWCDLEGRCALHNSSSVPMSPEVCNNAKIYFEHRKFQHVFDARAPDVEGSKQAAIPTPQADLVQHSLVDLWSRGPKRARSTSRSLSPEHSPAPKTGLRLQEVDQHVAGQLQKRQWRGTLSGLSVKSQPSGSGMGMVSNPPPPSETEMQSLAFSTLVAASTTEDGAMPETMTVNLQPSGAFSWSCLSNNPAIPRLALDNDQPFHRWACRWVCDEPGKLPTFSQELMFDIGTTDIPV